MTSSINNLAQPQIPIMKIPVLKGNNYEIWSMKMKFLLEYQGVWDIVLAEPVTDENREKDKNAHYLIYRGLDDCLDDIVHRQILAAESSKKAWDILETKYKNAASLPVNLHALLFVAISAGFVLRLLFGDVPSHSGMQSFVLIEVFAMTLLIYVIYKIAAIKITNTQFAAMAIGAVLGMIVGISGPLLGASMNPARLAGSSISIYMILGAVLGGIYSDVITPPSVPPQSGANADGASSGAPQSGTNVVGASPSGANVVGGSPSGTNVLGGSPSGANVVGGSPSGTNVLGGSPSGATLSGP